MNVNEIVNETNRALDKLLDSGAAPSGLSAAPSGGSAGQPGQSGPPVFSPPVLPSGSGRGLLSAVPGKLEHSLLDPSISREKITGECKKAADHGVGVVVVSPYYVEHAVDILGRTGTAVCSVAGFPHGAASAAAKTAELRECIRRGATEMDVAVNVLAIKSGEVDAARRELQELIQTARQSQTRSRCRIKAIYEQALYTEEEKKIVLSLIRECACDFVKISNALSGKKAEEDDVRFVRSIVGDKVGIKIDGGVKTLEKTLSLLEAGAGRIGLTATIAVAREALGLPAASQT